MRKVVYSILLAAILWFVMFFPNLGLDLNFWAVMAAASLTLTAWALFFGGKPRGSMHWSEFVLGAAIAVVLWGVFWLGDKCSQLLFDFARPQVDMIYGIKDGSSPTLIGLLLLLLIGPGEEIFWRGYVQRLCSERWSPNVGFVLATAAYTLIHVSSLNFMLTMAAMVCGIAWGGLYRLFPKHFTAIVVSHALWDAAAFVWFPF
ncbi:MAG: CPBP family intramembrane metalloprotease [Bacteroidales bacterium]|nr:CPBP family intramembrane metalloprotease [Bacteroidales bacterium]